MMIRCIWIVFIVAVLAGCGDTVYAEDRLIETRYCGKPARTTGGKIKRSAIVIRTFERLYPLPAGYTRSDWAIDHVIPLANGGCDAVRNMQWMPAAGKSCSEDYCKDRYERVVYPFVAHSSRIDSESTLAPSHLK